MSLSITFTLKGRSATESDIQFNVNSFSFGVFNNVEVTGVNNRSIPTSRDVDLTLVRAADTNSPRLFRNCAEGTLYKRAVLAVSQPNADGVSTAGETITFIDIILASMINKGSENGEQTPMEELKFEFGKLNFQVGEQQSFWDFETNSAFR